MIFLRPTARSGCVTTAITSTVSSSINRFKTPVENSGVPIKITFFIFHLYKKCCGSISIVMSNFFDPTSCVSIINCSKNSCNCGSFLYFTIIWK